ncbi:hypothetical protein [Pantoea sp. AS-PWVM4]|uniref:hypothetical protein n=1 Tax=Pantoea sp. AS-PWVM4 TaxID=1332069 RepID=UPI00056CBD10|nr:hypothetical protein [Pantoea sp. AS-PWVM4]
MKLLQQTHQVNFFTNNEEITTTNPVISLLMERLAKFHLMPTYGQEINGITGDKRQIFAMMDFEQKFKIEFPSHGILINCLGVDFDDFFNRALDVLSALQSCFPAKKGNRIAVLSTTIYKANEERYEKLYNELFTYHAVKPFEWDNRIALRKKIDDFDEEVNSISTIKRGEIVAPFMNGGIPTDCIVFETDTNTLPQNGVMRFGWENVLNVAKALCADNKINMKRLGRYSEL